MAKVPKEPPVTHLFLSRIRREGRWNEWLKTVKRLMDETGKDFVRVRSTAMRELGYVDAKTERWLDEKYRTEIPKSALQLQIEHEKKEIAEERRVEDFEEAVRMLPDHCPASVVMDWVAAHPAMTRLARSKDKTKLIMITADDILLAPNGRAPSKEAARSLQHWANCPHEFFKQRLSEQKKAKAGDETSAKMDMDEDIEKIEQLLREVEGAV